MSHGALLDRLAELLPPPASAPPTDWPAVEAEVGSALPADFKAFCDRWGNGGDIETTGPVSVYRQAREAREFGSVLHDLREDDEALDDVALHPEPGGLLCWGGSESRHVLLWSTRGAPDDWEVVVSDLLPVHTGLRFVEWLVAALEGDLPPAHVPPELHREAGDPAPRWSAR